MESARVLSVRLSALSHATEDLEKVLRAIRELCPEGFSGNVETAKARGHYGNEIVMLRVKSKSSEQAERFFAHIWGRLSDSDQELVITRVKERTDSSATVFIRVGKQESYRGEIVLRELDPIKEEIQFANRGLSDVPTVGKIRNRMIAQSHLEN